MRHASAIPVRLRAALCPVSAPAWSRPDRPRRAPAVQEPPHPERSGTGQARRRVRRPAGRPERRGRPSKAAPSGRRRGRRTSRARRRSAPSGRPRRSPRRPARRAAAGGGGGTRRPLPPLPLPPGVETVWDGRWAITVAGPGWFVVPAAGRRAQLSNSDRAYLDALPTAARGSWPVLIRNAPDAAVLAREGPGAVCLVETRLALALDTTPHEGALV